MSHYNYMKVSLFEAITIFMAIREPSEMRKDDTRLLIRLDKVRLTDLRSVNAGSD